MKQNAVKVFLFISILLITALLVPFAFNSANIVKEAFNNASFVVSSEEEGMPETTKKETLAVWIATVHNLNFHTRLDMTEAEVREEAKEIIENVSLLGMNTVYLQVRPTADAFYASKVFPYSALISGVQGEYPGYDSLSIFIEEAKKKDIEVHAWINPYRITSGSLKHPNTDREVLSENHPASIHPEWVVEYGGALYFNPAIPEVRDLIIAGAVELAENYDIAGIHMDDYFYPYPIYDNGVKLEFDDIEEYNAQSNGISIENWRRSNVNKLIEGLYTSIKIVNQELEFGISPFGVWLNDDGSNGGSATNAGIEGFNDLYADSLSWINNKYIDYIAPQIYWSFEDSNTPFDTIYNWWAEKIKDTGIRFIPGLAVYKVNSVESVGWQETTQLQKQLRYVREKLSASGAAFYGYNELITESEAIELLISEIRKTE